MDGGEGEIYNMKWGSVGKCPPKYLLLTFHIYMQCDFEEISISIKQTSQNCKAL